MRTFFILGSFLTASLLVANCGSDAVTCDESHTCAIEGDGSTPTVDGSTGDGPITPEGCDAKADPKDAPKCVDDSFGIFVDATNGQDGNPGTKAAPLKSISGALANLSGKTRLYVCSGLYAEHVKLTSAVSIFGGFTCGTWAYDGAPNSLPKVNSADGYALEIHKVAGAFTIADMSFTAAAGTADSVSSIAAFVETTSALTLRRDQFVAGNGFQGKSATKAPTVLLMSSMPTAGTLGGNNSTDKVGGLAQSCTCADMSTSKGGAGGAPGIPTDAAANGKAGEIAQASPDPGVATGAGGTAMECVGNQGGRPGSNAPPASVADGAAISGKLTEQGFAPEAGASGVAGKPGQGGGGGGGAVNGGGGGGGCGGCGGGGGVGGTGGGASVALLLLDSPVSLSACTLATGAGGAGGAGGPGGDGAGGGPTGAKTGDGCSGGKGGTGGAGGAGGGGAGGVSATILYKGAMPVNQGSMLTPGAKGDKGLGGATPANDGVDGQAGEMLSL